MYSLKLFICLCSICASFTKQPEGRVSKPATVLELFTSEGCSSCPPAESYTAELARDKDILLLSYHVDYWNRLGWNDSYSLPEFTSLQYAYSRRLGLSSVYTPQAIINGQREAVGSDRKKIPELIHKALPFEDLITSVHTSLQDHSILVQAKTRNNATQLQFLLVLNESVTAVKSGENAGTTLHHEHIVKEMTVTGPERQKEFKVDITTKPSNYSIVVLARDPATLAIRDARVISF